MVFATVVLSQYYYFLKDSEARNVEKLYTISYLSLINKNTISFHEQST
jgi:hypothetical protein